MYQDKYEIKIDQETFHVPYPTVGQQLDIENMKSLLSAGKYASIGAVESRTSEELLNLIDAVSYFYTLVPELKDKIDIKNFTAMSPVLQKRLSKAYVKYYTEFVVKVDAEINKELEGE